MDDKTKSTKIVLVQETSGYYDIDNTITNIKVWKAALTKHKIHFYKVIIKILNILFFKSL